MFFQITLRLGILLSAQFVLGHFGAMQFDVLPVLPSGEHQTQIAARDALADAHLLGFLTGENIRKQVYLLLYPDRKQRYLIFFASF